MTVHDRTRLIGQLHLLKKPRFGGVFAFVLTDFVSWSGVAVAANEINSQFCDSKHISLFYFLLVKSSSMGDRNRKITR